MSLSSFFTSIKNQELYPSNHERALHLWSGFGGATRSFISWRTASSVHMKERAMPSRTAGLSPRGIRRVSSTKAPSRSWVARILIDEALAILRQRNAALMELSK